MYIGMIDVESGDFSLAMKVKNKIVGLESKELDCGVRNIELDCRVTR